MVRDAHQLGGMERASIQLACALNELPEVRAELLTSWPLRGPRELPLAQGLRTWRVPAHPRLGSATPAAQALFLCALRRRFDLLCGVQLTTGGFVAACAGRAARLPVVLRPALGGALGESATLRRWSPWRRRVILGAERYAALSEEIARELVELGVPRQRVARVHNGVDAARFAPAESSAARRRTRARLGLPPEGRVLLFVGRLTPQKRPLDLVRAFARLAPAEPDARLVLCGEGELRAPLERAIAALGLAGQVELRGAVEGVADYYRAADAFALPSAAEGAPNSLLEAMASGLACVATPVGAVPELIEPERSGLLVPVGDEDALAQALRALADPGRRARLGAAARARALAELSLEAVALRYAELFRAALAERRRR